MQRPIKFRAWEKSEKRMIPWENSEFDSGLPGYDSVDMMPMVYFEGMDKDADDYIFMQFTGLLDKNGKEIYEGDFLQDKLSTVDDSIKKVEFTIGWGGDSEPIAGYNFHGLYESNFHFDEDGVFNDYEIVGNIYENPELLTK